MKKKCLKYHSFLASIISGLIIGFIAYYFLINYIYSISDSDFKRTKYLLESLHEKEFKPNVLFFGNSVCMNGIDASFLNSGKKIYAYNLSSGGQRLGESFLFYQEIPHAVKYIIQFASVNDLMENNAFASRETFTTFYMYRYRPNSYTKETLSKIFKSEATGILNQSDLSIKIDARKRIVSLPNSILRNLLRSDLAIEKSNKDLFYPSPFKEKISEQELTIMIKKNSPKKPLTNFFISENKMALLKESNHFFTMSNSNFILVIAPINPRMTHYTESYYNSINRVVDSLNAQGLKIINCSRILSSDEFVDHFHPDKNGAEKVTKYIEKEIF
jgi:hypothetical protein